MANPLELNSDSEWVDLLNSCSSNIQNAVSSNPTQYRTTVYILQYKSYSEWYMYDALRPHETMTETLHVCTNHISNKWNQSKYWEFQVGLFSL